jgi:hypothetical protein
MAAVPEGKELRPRKQAEFGRLLSAAAGYRVLTQDGHELGLLAHVRYTQHADHPDELVLRRRLFRKRPVVVPFSAVTAVDRVSRTITLRSMP